MTYINRRLDDETPISFVDELPIRLRRGVDYWAIFAGAFEPDELAFARQAHAIDGPMLQRRRDWYIENNHHFERFKDKILNDIESEDFVAALETCLTDEEMADMFGPGFEKLFNNGEDTHIATSAEGLRQSGTVTTPKLPEKSQSDNGETDPRTCSSFSSLASPPLLSTPQTPSILYSRTAFLENDVPGQSDSEEEDNAESAYDASISQHTTSFVNSSAKESITFDLLNPESNVCSPSAEKPVTSDETSSNTPARNTQACPIIVHTPDRFSPNARKNVTSVNMPSGTGIITNV
jgi:hypothetical protein